MNIMIFGGAGKTSEPIIDLLNERGHDVARAFAQAAETEFSGYHAANIIGSYQSGRLFPPSIAKELLSFECEERFREY